MPDTRALTTSDGVRIDAVHDAGPADLGIVVAHGFTGSWRRPAVRRLSLVLSRYGGVVGFDFRGHGASGGASTVGDKEIHDVAAAVDWARDLGYRRVATVGFSMGSSAVVRHAGLLGGVDAVVAVSGPSRWYYRGTVPMRRVHWIVEQRLGRIVGRYVLGTRIAGGTWEVIPEPPNVAVAKIAPVPLLVVHGDADTYFPVEHAEALYAAAGEPKELWIEHGMGHAENAVSDALAGRIGAWLAGR